MSNATTEGVGLPVGDDRGVTVATYDDKVLVEMPFDRELVIGIRQLAGVEYIREDDVWEAPVGDVAKTAEIIEKLRVSTEGIAQAHAEINALATASAVDLQGANGTAKDIVPQVNDYIKKGAPYYGKILNVNDRFAAQLTGFGKQDGAAFVTVHRLANLKTPSLMKGDDVRIKYDDKGLGEVVDRSKIKTADQQAVDFDQSLGEAVDGVTVAEVGDQYRISFPFNPTLAERLRRIEGVELDKTANEFTAPVAARDFVIRAVTDMRAESVAENQERGKLSQEALKRVDGAKTRDAFTRDGIKHPGEIVAKGERFALQFGGAGNFKLHRLTSLQDAANLKVGDDVTISYTKGRGAIGGRDAVQAPPVKQSELAPGAVGSTEHKAQRLLGGAKTAPGLYVGVINSIDTERQLAFQSVGRGVSEVFKLDTLSRVPAVGESTTIAVDKDGRGKVADPKAQGLAQGAER